MFISGKDLSPLSLSWTEKMGLISFEGGKLEEKKESERGRKGETGARKEISIFTSFFWIRHLDRLVYVRM